MSLLLLFKSPHSHAVTNFAFVASATGGTWAGHHVTCDKPTGTAENDIMFAYVTYQSSYSGDANPTTVPSGWTLVGGRQDPSATFSMWLYYKVAGASEGASYEWIWTLPGNSANLSVAVSSWRGGFYIASPIDSHSDGTYVVNDTTLRATTATAALANAPCIWFGGVYTATTKSCTPPTGYTEVYDTWLDTPDVLQTAAWNLVPAGATGNVDGTISSAFIPKGAMLVILLPGPSTQTIDRAKWTLYPHQARSTTQWFTEEGVAPAERSRSTTGTAVANCPVASTWTDICSYYCPMPPGAILTAGTYVLRVRISAGATAIARFNIDINAGVTVYTGTPNGVFVAEEYLDLVCAIVSDTPVGSQLLLKVQGQGVGGTRAITVKPCYLDVYFGTQTGAAGTARNALVGTVIDPPAGTHASPAAIVTPTPTFTIDLQYAYPDDVLTLVKSTDTVSTSAHSASAPTTQALDTAANETDSFSGTSTRRITVTADATRKADTITNSYYQLAVHDAGAADVGTVPLEVRLAVERPQLTTLNGAAVGTYVTTDYLEPWVEWVDPNEGLTTHYQVRVYDTSDVLQHDSTETAVGATAYQIPVAAALSTATTYYVKVTLVKGSGGSAWAVDSLPGYFQIADAATTVKITSHEGTSDTYEVITDTTPAFTWYFPRTQHSFNLTVYDETDKAVAYNSGWTVSATQGHTVPSALTLGHNFSVQVQVRDAQQVKVYSADKRAWIHTNESTVPTPVLTAEPDTDSKTSITLAWTASAIADSDVINYLVRIVPDSTGRPYFYSAGQATSFVIGCLAADTYNWSAQATDDHGMSSAWATDDEFVVSVGGATPVCTLMSQPATVAPLVTHWSYADADGDAQSKYQVQLDDTSDAFGSIIEDSGAVSSTNTYYSHTTDTVGTYYRRARVYTATEWSAWDDDAVSIVNPTSQSEAMELFRRHSDGILSKIFLPMSGVVATRRLDGPGSFQFTMDHFYPWTEDGLEGVYFFDEISGTVAHDIENLDDLTLAGSPAWTNAVLNLAGDDYGDAGVLVGSVTIAGTWTMYLVVSTTGSSGTLVFLGANADDLNYVRLEYNGSGKVRLSAKGGGVTKTTDDLTVPTTGWVCLRILHDGVNLKVKRMDTAVEKSTDTVAATGDSRLSVGHYDGATPGSIVNTAKVAALLVYTGDVTANDTQNYRACKENLKHRLLEVL